MTFHRAFNQLQRQTLENVIGAETAPSRFELSSRFGVSPQTMTRAVKGLVEDGVLDEEPDATGTRGQPSRRLVFRSGSLLVVGLVMADHRIAVTVEDLAGNRLLKDEEFGRFQDPEPATTKAVAMIRKAFDAFHEHRRIVGLGVAAQGFFTERGRRMISNGNPAAWPEVDLKASLEAQTGLPTVIQNDAKAIAVGTIRDGLARRHGHYFCLYLAGGIGGALVREGQLYEGRSANAGEVGYFVPRDGNRPVVGNFLRAAEIDDLGSWQESRAVEGSVLEWCKAAGASLGVVAQMCVRMYDIDALVVCSPLPRPVLNAICQSIEVDAIGSNILGKQEAASLLYWPGVIPINDTSVNRGACALAAYHFLRSAPPEIDT